MTDSATLPSDQVNPQVGATATPTEPLTPPMVSSTASDTTTAEPVSSNSAQSTNDSPVDQLLQDTLQLQSDMQSSDQVMPMPSDDSTTQDSAVTQTTVPSMTASDGDTSTAPVVASDDAGKSPLDILEDILGAGQTGEEGKPVESTQTPEEVAAEIQAERERVAKEEEAIIEAHRQKLQSELQTPEQQKRDEVRGEQAEELKVGSQFDIPQLQRKKMVVGK